MRSSFRETQSSIHYSLVNKTFIEWMNFRKNIAALIKCINTKTPPRTVGFFFSSFPSTQQQRMFSWIKYLHTVARERARSDLNDRLACWDVETQLRREKKFSDGLKKKNQNSQERRENSEMLKDDERKSKELLGAKDVCADSQSNEREIIQDFQWKIPTSSIKANNIAKTGP